MTPKKVVTEEDRVRLNEAGAAAEIRSILRRINKRAIPEPTEEERARLLELQEYRRAIRTGKVI